MWVFWKLFVASFLEWIFTSLIQWSLFFTFNFEESFFQILSDLCFFHQGISGRISGPFEWGATFALCALRWPWGQCQDSFPVAANALASKREHAHMFPSFLWDVSSTWGCQHYVMLFLFLCNVLLVLSWVEISVIHLLRLSCTIQNVFKFLVIIVRLK